MGIKKVRISELPLCKTLVGLFTIGVDKDNRSVKVGLEFIENAANGANAAAAAANDAAVAAQGVVAGLGNVIDVLAHSDCTLDARVASLERLLAEVLAGRAYIPELQVRRLGVWGACSLVLTGEGAPAKAPDRVGQFYIDTASRALYYAAGNTAVADWKIA